MAKKILCDRCCRDITEQEVECSVDLRTVSSNGNIETTRVKLCEICMLGAKLFLDGNDYP